MAPIVIAPLTLKAALSERLTVEYIAEMRGLRPGEILELKIREDLWMMNMESDANDPRSITPTPNPTETDADS